MVSQLSQALASVSAKAPSSFVALGQPLKLEGETLFARGTDRTGDKTFLVVSTIPPLQNAPFASGNYHVVLLRQGTQKELDGWTGAERERPEELSCIEVLHDPTLEGAFRPTGVKAVFIEL